MTKGKLRITMAVAMVASMVAMLCCACGQQAKNDTTPKDAKQAYEAFIQEQKEDGNKDEIYAAITTTSEDGSEVLLIADDTLSVNNQATKASVYSYSDGQVTKIGDIESTSSAYPIGSFEEKYLVTGSHHTLERYLVSGNTASVEKVEGLATEKGNYKMTTSTIANDKISNAEEKEISVEEGDKFATAIYAAWEPIEFTKY